MNSTSVPAVIGNAVKSWTFTVQDYSILAAQSIRNIFTSSRYFADLIEQMDIIGVGSLRIVLVALLCVGGVIVLNAASQFARFGET
ncbi:MAG: hypothetical protein WCE52_03265, partial [Candidatus Acidiferrum sp.]